MIAPSTTVRALLLLSCSLWGCGSSAVDGNDAGSGGSGGSGGAGSGGGSSGSGGKAPVPGETPDYGLGDGTLDSVVLTEIYRPELIIPLHATALAWNANVAGELWVTLRQFPSGLPCTNADDRGCNSLPGVVAILSDATSAAPVGTIKEDWNSWHFMRRPTSIAWGDTDLFATCGEARTDNLEDEPTPYAGPVLWSSDPGIFGVKPTGMQNGTHLDMLHESPYCMGIAHESGNAFWTVNGDAGSLDRYDFHAPHEIGGENHADGEVFRYARGELLRVPEVPSHLTYDAVRQLVYVADTGHGRVLSVDPKTATRGGQIMVYETLQDSGEMVGAGVTELVPPGLLEQPSGLLLSGDTLYVTDNGSSHIHAFDTQGQLLQSLDTGLPAGTLAGIAMGPDDKLYFTDLLTGAVRRID